MNYLLIILTALSLSIHAQETTPDQLQQDLNTIPSLEMEQQEMPASVTEAINGHGNGGDAIVTPEGTQLLDLMEKESFCMECLPAFDEEVKPRLIKIEKAYLELHQALHKRTNREILYFHNMLAKAIENMNWYFVDYELPNIADEGKVHAYLEKNKKQIAIQKDGEVFIDRVLFDELDSINQGALFLHELILNVCLNQNIDLTKNGTANIRTLVNLLFSGNLDNLSGSKIIKKIRDLKIMDMYYAKDVDGDGMTLIIGHAALKTDEKFASQMDTFSDEVETNLNTIKNSIKNLSIDGVTNDRQEIKDKMEQSLKQLLEENSHEIAQNIQQIIKKLDINQLDDKVLSTYKYKYSRHLVDLTVKNDRRRGYKKWSRNKIQKEASKLAAMEAIAVYAQMLADAAKERQQVFEYFVEIYLNK